MFVSVLHMHRRCMPCSQTITVLPIHFGFRSMIAALDEEIVEQPVKVKTMNNEIIRSVSIG